MSVSGRQVALAAQAMLVSVTGRSCGYGTAPAADAQPTGNTLPYSVLYELGQVGGFGPPFGDADADARVYLQVSSEGWRARSPWTIRTDEAVFGGTPAFERARRRMRPSSSGSAFTRP
ncbi:hypothetical protein [Streptomyces sp. NPDC057257]|uniref:hypothetical protein n=1 Tax=Streptomyces sp. NPDC057257 TaxID=3346071 RepID=UPI0036383687